MSTNEGRVNSGGFFVQNNESYLSKLYKKVLQDASQIQSKNIKSEGDERYTNKNSKSSGKFHRRVKSTKVTKSEISQDLSQKNPTSFENSKKSFQRKTNSMENRFASKEKPYLKYMRISQNLQNQEKANLLLKKIEIEKKVREAKKVEKLKSQEQSIMKELDTLTQEKELMLKAFDHEKKRQIEDRLTIAQQIRQERQKQEEETKIVLKKILTNNKHIIRGPIQSAKERNTNAGKLRPPPFVGSKSISLEKKFQKQLLPPLSSGNSPAKNSSFKADTSNIVNSIGKMKDKIEYLESLVGESK